LPQFDGVSERLDILYIQPFPDGAGILSGNTVALNKCIMFKNPLA
jgi:hypothetical protein